MYHLPELETARRWNLNVVIIVNNNSMFSQSIRGVNRAYGDRPGEKSDIYKFTPLNFARIAESFGCRGLRVEKPGAIRAALEEALQSNQPVVVDVVTDGQHPAPWAKPAGRTFPMN
jgi:acetolactate synthase-1/2/3 large subunit